MKGATVRTTGTNRPTVMVGPPKRSKQFLVCSRWCGLTQPLRTICRPGEDDADQLSKSESESSGHGRFDDCLACRIAAAEPTGQESGRNQPDQAFRQECGEPKNGSAQFAPVH